jgi:hypothetical protein
MRRAHVGRSKADPLRVIPEIGQIAEYGTECPQRPG